MPVPTWNRQGWFTCRIAAVLTSSKEARDGLTFAGRRFMTVPVSTIEHPRAGVFGGMHVKTHAP